MIRFRRLCYVGLFVLAGLFLLAFYQPFRPHLGLQPDGSYVVSTGQRIEGGAIRFPGRPSDLALHPSGNFFAVMKKDAVFLCRTSGVVPNSEVKLGASPGPHGLIWTPDGRRLIASTASGYLQTFDFDGIALSPGPKIVLKEAGEKTNPVPCGLTMTRDGKTLYVAAMNLNAVVQVDLDANKPIRRLPVQTMPFGVRLTADESGLVVTNWGGRTPREDDDTAMSEDLPIVVDKRGAPSSGTVSLIDLRSGATKNLDVGIHPSAVAVAGNRAFVANTMSDSISEIDLAGQKVVRTMPITWGKMAVVGAMPTALAISGNTLYATDGGDNAVCVLDLASGAIRGFMPAGFFPISLTLAGDTRSS